MTLSRTTLGALVSVSALFLAHCSSNGDGGSQAQGGAAGGNTPANGGSGTGGSGTGGSGTGGATNGGSGTGGSGTGGASNGGASGGSTANGGSSMGGGASGGSSNGGASSGGTAGSSNKGGGTSSGGTAGSSSGGGANKGGSAGQSSGGQGGGSSTGFALTSTTLAPGMTFPAEATCAHAAGTPDKSPPFAWTNPPSGTLSYALVLVDMSIMATHWVLWDIPGASTSLPEALASGATLTMPAGAKQVAGFTGNPAQYLGPCPSGMLHTYVFTLYALDVATLPNLTTSSNAAAVITAIQAHDLASATLSGTSNAKKP